MSNNRTRVNAVTEVRTRLFKMSADWDDALLDVEDDALDYIVNNAPQNMQEGHLGVGIYNEEDQAEPHFEFLIFNGTVTRGTIQDHFRFKMLPTQDLMDIRIIDWEVANEGRMATFV